MKEYYGNYLGIVISGGDKDPEHRCRCQVFIPHIMPALHSSWFGEGNQMEDTFIQIVGTNLENSFTGKQVETLKKILPWAECAAPIIGAGPSTRVMPDGQASETMGNTGFAIDLNTDFTGSLGIDSILSTPPTAQERQNIYRNGGVVVNLDTNWSAGGSAVRPEAIIPDDATPTMRAAAQSYVDQVAATYNKQFGTNLTGAVLTRSENRARNPERAATGWMGGRNGTIHTEPFSVTDTRAANFFTRTAEGRNALASITANTLGKIPGAKFSLPHGGLTGGDKGAAGSLGNEVDFAKILLNDITAGLTTSENLFNVPPGVTPAGGEQGGKAADGRAGTSTTARIENESTNNEGGGGTTRYTGNPSNMSSSFRDQYNRVYRLLGNSKLVGTKPDDGAKFGIYEGTREEWAHFFTRLASVESSFTANTQADINGNKPGDPGYNGKTTSYGLYQMGLPQFNKYGGRGLSWSDPEASTSVFINYAEALYFGDGVYGVRGGQNKIAADNGGGIAAGYGPLKRSIDGDFLNTREPWVLAQNMAAAEQVQNVTTQQDTQYPAVKRDPLTNEAVAFGSSFGMDTNFQATGMFGYAREGQLVWCFFREGNPMFPVYFAASYGAEEYARIRQATSPGEMEEGFDSTIINLQAGGIRSAQTFQDLNKSGLGNDMAFEVYSKMGHNFRMGTDTVELNSLYNFRQQTEGDHYNITLQNRETRTMGDANTVIGQDCYVTIGNWDTDALEAADELQKIVNEAMEIGDEG